jgi:hypothetical protein
MREIRQSGSEGGARFNPSFLSLSILQLQEGSPENPGEGGRGGEGGEGFPFIFLFNFRSKARRKPIHAMMALTI